MTGHWTRSPAYDGHVGAGAITRQAERDNLGELIQLAEAEHGPVAEGEIAALRGQLQQARWEQVGGGADDALAARSVAPGLVTASPRQPVKRPTAAAPAGHTRYSASQSP